MGGAKPLIARESATYTPDLHSPYCGVFGSSYIYMTRLNLIFLKRLRDVTDELLSVSRDTSHLMSRLPMSRTAMVVAGVVELVDEVLGHRYK